MKIRTIPSEMPNVTIEAGYRSSNLYDTHNNLN